jgi:hypothetical protein
LLAAETGMGGVGVGGTGAGRQAKRRISGSRRGRRDMGSFRCAGMVARNGVRSKGMQRRGASRFVKKEVEFTKGNHVAVTGRGAK